MAADDDIGLHAALAEDLFSKMIASRRPAAEYDFGLMLIDDDWRLRPALWSGARVPPTPTRSHDLQWSILFC